MRQISLTSRRSWSIRWRFLVMCLFLGSYLNRHLSELVAAGIAGPSEMPIHNEPRGVVICQSDSQSEQPSASP
jgi:hypothetical protein